MRLSRIAPRVLLLVVVGCPLLGASSTPDTSGTAAAERGVSSSHPLQPEYRIHTDGAVTLRICFNWSCAFRQALTFSATDMNEVARQMDLCPGEAQQDRLQRLRIGVWGMETLAQKYQPLLANDEAINDRDRDREGRMDCVDNASNTTNYLNVLHDLGLLPGWSMESPQVRNVLSLSVHWTAVVVDTQSATSWSVDSWYRPNGQLPFIMPLADWAFNRIAWEAPFAAMNPYPRYSDELCGTRSTERTARK